VVNNIRFEKMVLSPEACGTAYTVHLLIEGRVIGYVQSRSFAPTGHGFAVWLAYLPGGEPLRVRPGDWPVEVFQSRHAATEALLKKEQVDG
jgi:hypothetical protein